MNNSRIRDIKHAQKESFLLREVSLALGPILAENETLHNLYISRAKLSPDKGRVTIFFSCPGGKDEFDQKLQSLVLYKPSLRAALANALQSRYTPEITFAYDAVLEKAQRVDNLIQKLKDEDKL